MYSIGGVKINNNDLINFYELNHSSWNHNYYAKPSLFGFSYIATAISAYGTYIENALDFKGHRIGGVSSISALSATVNAFSKENISQALEGTTRAIFGTVAVGIATPSALWVAKSGTPQATLAAAGILTSAQIGGEEIGAIYHNSVVSAVNHLLYTGADPEAGYIESTMGLAPPVVLDLDGDGVELVNVDESSVFFDIDDDGFIENVGWAAADDGLLVIDLASDGSEGPDGQITLADEFVFTRHAAGSTSDLEALLLAFDSNYDGVLDASDQRWTDFKVWQDQDQDGISDSGELKTLTELGITSIDLNGVPYVPAEGVEPGPKDNEIAAMSSYTKADNSTSSLADVAFKYSVYGYQWDDSVSGGVRLNAENGEDILYLEDSADHVMDVLASGYVGAFGGDGTDQLSAGGDNATFVDTLLDGGVGDDTLIGGYGDDWLSGGDGADSISGGAGHDVLFIDVDDTLIDGGADNDVGIIVSTHGMTLDVGAANLEVVYGNDGEDVLSSSGTESVHLDGAAGNDSLSGGSGNDMLVGGDGADALDGGAGDDTLFIDSLDTSIAGGDGYDVAYVSTEAGVTVDAGAAELEAVFGNGLGLCLQSAQSETVV